MLVGNKSDLEVERAVTQAEGKELADKWGCSWIETSAKGAKPRLCFVGAVLTLVSSLTANINVNEAFFEVVRLIKKFRTDNPELNKKKDKKGCNLL